MPFAELRNGLRIADTAIRLAVALEARGHVLSVKAGALHVSNGSALTAADRAAITAQRWHLMAIATYGQEDTWIATESEAHDLSGDRPRSKLSKSAERTTSTSTPPELHSSVDSKHNASKSQTAASSTATSLKSSTHRSRSVRIRSNAFDWEQADQP